MRQPGAIMPGNVARFPAPGPGATPLRSQRARIRYACFAAHRSTLQPGGKAEPERPAPAEGNPTSPPSKKGAETEKSGRQSEKETRDRPGRQSSAWRSAPARCNSPPANGNIGPVDRSFHPASTRVISKAGSHARARRSASVNVQPWSIAPTHVQSAGEKTVTGDSVAFVGAPDHPKPAPVSWLS